MTTSEDNRHGPFWPPAREKKKRKEGKSPPSANRVRHSTRTGKREGGGREGLPNGKKGEREGRPKGSPSARFN